ncbi:MAG: chromate resistance protein [Candidatus Omnitrophica bacterium]|nr:chromate resistance protein [Candidatus Omnitrophota bacterium]
MKKIILFLLGLVFFMGSAGLAANPHLYSTANVLQLDACASAWLIKNFVDKDAEFKFYPKGELITEGVAFDTPDAELRRTANKSTFENILKKYNIKDAKLEKIGSMIHSIEINFWEDKTGKEALKLKDNIKGMIEAAKSPQDLIRVTDGFFNKLYQTEL